VRGVTGNESAAALKAPSHQRVTPHRKRWGIGVQILASEFKNQIATLSHRHGSEGGSGGAGQLLGCA
jgi:hypothetical protein